MTHSNHSDENLMVLVKALLSPDSENAKLCLEQWERATDVSDLDGRALRLIPLLSDRCKQHKIEIPFPKAVSKMERYWWLKHRWNERVIQPLLAHWIEQGMTPVVIKGLAVQNQIARPLNRTMSDIDVWLPYEQIDAAIDSLYAAGFEMDASIRMRYEQNPERYRLLRHAVPFHHTKLDVEFDLHWRLGGLVARNRVTDWLSNSATVELTLDGWAKGIRAMSGVPLVRTIMGNGYMDGNWSSAMWIFDLHQLTQNWSLADWEELKKSFFEDGVDFMWFWCLSTLFENGAKLPPKSFEAATPQPSIRYRRNIYYPHKDMYVRYVSILARVHLCKVMYSAFRHTQYRAYGERFPRKVKIFVAFFQASP